MIFGTKSAGAVEDLVDGAAGEAAAKDGGHRLGQSLHLGAKGDFERGFPVLDLEKDSDLVRALLILADIFQLEGLALFGAPLVGAFGEGDEVLSTLHLGKNLEQFDDFGQAAWITHFVRGVRDSEIEVRGMAQSSIFEPRLR